jgi:hypothetical protein
MNELASLLPILPYALSVALLAALLHRLAEWTDGPSLASLVGGPRDLTWPRGVQEEEPIRWHIEALRPRRDQRQSEVTRTEPDRQRSVAPGPRPCQAARPGA